MPRPIKISLAVGVVAAIAAGILAFRPSHPDPATGHHLAVIPAGSFLVWSEVDPGTYRATGRDQCAWSRSPSVDPLSGQVTQHGQAGPGEQVTVTIAEDDGRFASEGCSTWTRVKN